MLQIFSKRLPLELIGRHSYCHLRYIRSITTKTSATELEDEKSATKATSPVDLVESVAVPVQNVPTLDTSWRSAPGITQTKVNQNAAKEIKVERMPWNVTPDPDPRNLLSHYKKLSKFRLTSLVVLTSMAGYTMAPAHFDLTTFALCSIGTGLVSAAANSINQFHEVPFDSQMSRTKNRVLVTGLLTPLHAVGFALVTATTGLSVLYYGVNGLTAALAGGNLFLYTSVYTPMKRYSIVNTWVGSIVGAIPPLMGWAGCSGTLDPGAWILAGLLYAWQFPHFNALSWNLRPDYSRAGYRMMAVTNPGLCRRTALRYTIALMALSLTAPMLDVTNVWFALETLPLNAYFCYLAWQFYRNSDSGTSRKLFRFSLVHLPALMLLFLFNKKRWIFTESAVEETYSGDSCEILNKVATGHLLQTPIQVLPVAVAAAAATMPSLQEAVTSISTTNKNDT